MIVRYPHRILRYQVWVGMSGILSGISASTMNTWRSPKYCNAACLAWGLLSLKLAFPGVQAQLLAVGLSNGEVALYKLWNVKGGEPVRIISLADWGFEPETSGSVADLQWSPDNRAIAVRFVVASGIYLPHLSAVTSTPCLFS